MELLGPEGTGFEKPPEINQQVRLQFDNLPLNYPRIVKKSKPSQNRGLSSGRVAFRGCPPLPSLSRLGKPDGVEREFMDWTRTLAYITGSVDQELLLRNEYLAAENRIMRAQLNGCLRLSDAERATLGEAFDWAARP